MPFPAALPGSRISGMPGLENKLEFNGIVLGDLSTADCYRITEMQGFSDGISLRSNYRQNPSTHGEIALNNYLNGRTMTISGKIVAHNTDKMRDMITALKTAFITFNEYPLYIRNQSTPARDTYINCRFLDLQIPEKQDSYDFFRDFQLTLKASDPTFRSTTTITNTVKFGLLDTNPGVGVTQWTVVAGSAPSVVAGNLVMPGGAVSQQYRRNDMGYTAYESQVTAKITTPTTITTNDNIGIILKDKDNAGNTGLLGARLFFTSATVARVDITKTITGAFGVGTTSILASTGTFTVAANTAYWLVTNINGNVVTARAFSTDPSTGAGTPLSTLDSTTLSGGDIALLGNTAIGNPGLYCLVTNASGARIDDYRVEPITINSVLSPFPLTNNIGNFRAIPQIKFYGPVNNVFITTALPITDENNLRYFQIMGAIPAGDYYVYDFDARTLVNSTGVNKIIQLNTNSQDIFVPPNTSNWIVTATGPSFSTANGYLPQIDIIYQATFI